MSNRIEPQVFRDGNSKAAREYADFLIEAFGSVVWETHEDSDGKVDGVILTPGDPPRCPTCGTVRYGHHG